MKEIRNNYSFRTLCSLLHQGVFKVATEAHLRVGHTHEDVDAVFSLCASALKSCPDLQTPRDIQRRIQDKVGRVFEAKGVPFSIDILGVDPLLVSDFFHVSFCHVSLLFTKNDSER